MINVPVKCIRFLFSMSQTYPLLHAALQGMISSPACSIAGAGWRVLERALWCCCLICLAYFFRFFKHACGQVGSRENQLRMFDQVGQLSGYTFQTPLVLSWPRTCESGQQPMMWVKMDKKQPNAFRVWICIRQLICFCCSSLRGQYFTTAQLKAMFRKMAGVKCGHAGQGQQVNDSSIK